MCLVQLPLGALLLVAMAAVATLVVADDGPGTFRVKPEFPASQADPCKHTYVTLLLDASGPGGTFSEARGGTVILHCCLL
jgi:hypothetical protein